MSYSVVIPCYKNFEQLHQLLSSMATTNTRYKPTAIIIVNDGGYRADERLASAKGLLSSTLLPPLTVINLDKHVGPMGAFAAGLDAVDVSQSPYALMLHSDVLLHHEQGVDGTVYDTYEKVTDRYGKTQNVPRQFRMSIELDVMSVLYHYITQINDDKFPVGVTCHTLQHEFPQSIECGTRGLGRNLIPFSNERNKNFVPLAWAGANVRSYNWQRIVSADTTCMMLDVRTYREVGGFNQVYAPYLFWFDDYCARARSQNHHLYLTLDTVAYHPMYRNKPEGSLSVPTIKDYEVQGRLFIDTWKNHHVWTNQSLYDYKQGAVLGPS